MNVSAKELGANMLTADQVDAITHAYLDCLGMADVDNPNTDLGGLAEAARESADELENEFPFLLEGVEDE